MYYNYTYVPQFTEYAPGMQQPNQGTTNSAPRESTQPEGMANGFYSYVRRGRFMFLFFLEFMNS